MDNFHLVVGSTDCPINTLALTIGSSTVMSNEWSTLAMGLNIGSEHIRRLRDDRLLNKITNKDIISEVLELWVGKLGSSSTLDKLLNVVEGQCGANDAGESLRLHFRLPCKAADDNQSIDWDNIPPAFQNRITETFQKFFPTLKFLENLPNLKGPWLINLMTGKKPPLFVHPFPDMQCYYINRTLITRNIISKKIFEQDSSAIFLFTGLDPSELSTLAGNKLTGTSSAKLRYSSNDVKFMILDRANHFAKICEKASEPVHLLRRETDGRLRWIRSSGKMCDLQRCVDQSQDEFDEASFCRHLDSQTTSVLICDSPGMGKSVLLAQIGAALDQLHPDRTVLFVVFTEFMKQIKSIEMNDEVKMIEVALQKLTGEPVKINLDETASVTFELLLDGFDELDSVDYKQARSILRNISVSFKSTRLWATSRPHLMEELEASLTVLGYNIRPFDEQDQVQFLSSFWSRKEKLDKGRSRLFARKCLESLKSKMNSHSQDIAGIPLQCLLIGEVYEDDAVDYARLGNENEPMIGIDIGTITDLYRRLIRKKIDKYESMNGKLEEDELMGIHARLGLKLLFPDKMKALKLGPIPSVAELFKVGIIVKSSGVESSYAFLHRTFAEYFVAWFVVDKMGMDGEWTEEMNGFFHRCVLGCRDTEYYSYVKRDYLKSFEFDSPVICYFLNSSITDLIVGKNPPHLSSQLDTESPELMDKIAHACAYADLVHIFKLCHVRYESEESYKRKIFTERFLVHSIQHSSLELVKPVVTQLENLDRFSMEVKGEALRTAVKFGKFPIVEFLIKEKKARGMVEDLSYGAEELVHWCIYESVDRSDEEIKSRIQVFRMLIRINVSLLNGEVNGRPPLLFEDVHVKLLIELVQSGADVFAVDKYGTFLHLLGGRILSSSDYHILVMSIPDESLRQLVHMKGGKKGRTPLTSALKLIDPASETLDVFHRVGADFNYTDPEGSSVLEVAIAYRRSAVTIQKIIQLGDINVLEQAVKFSFYRVGFGKKNYHG